MCALSYFLEREGILTTGISLVRENTVSMQPPRALWVSFPLGRPLGVPNDVAFQHRVIGAALDLLNAERGPVLRDFPEDAPLVEIDDTPACPVTFAKPAKNNTTWQGALLVELEALKPWHDLGRRKRRGRTLVGISGVDAQENLKRLGRYLDDSKLPLNELMWFKAAIEDLKVFYIESLTAQPGNYNASIIEDIFWLDTTLGAALLKFAECFEQNSAVAGISRIIVPRSALEKSRQKHTLKTENEGE